MSPVLLVIAGPNGAGKTTITAQLRQERWSHGVEYINPDDVARDRFGDWNSPEASLKAAKWTMTGAIALADRLYVYDNSIDGVDARLCVRTAEGFVRKIYGPLPEWLDDAIRGVPPHAELVDLRAG